MFFTNKKSWPRDLRRRVDGETEARLFAVIGGQPFQEERRESGSGAASVRVEHEETLQTLAMVGHAAQLLHRRLDQLFADGVVATRVVVGRVLFARHQLIRTEQAAVRPRFDLVYDPNRIVLVLFRVEKEFQWGLYRNEF